MLYYLKHRDDILAVLSIEEGTDSLIEIEIAEENRKWLPFLGNADRKQLAAWIRARSIPATRDQIETVLREAGCRTRAEYLFKNLAVSVTDAYWIVPVDLALSWEEVSPFHSFSGRTIPVHHASSYSPNASLGGQMSKYIDLNGDKPRLIKRTKAHYGLQCLSEVVASTMHVKQKNSMPYVSYQAGYDPETGYYSCECAVFTSENLEFVPAYEVVSAAKRPNSVSMYDHFVHLCEQLGITEAGRFMDYMTLSDFALTNTDRHLNNFGILRDSVMGRAISMAPIFDSGNSLFYNFPNSFPMTREELLDIEITALHDREEKMLHHVKDRLAFRREDAIRPEQLKEFLIRGYVPKEQAAVIAENYAAKLELLEEYQSGISISHYKAKQKRKKGHTISFEM